MMSSQYIVHINSCTFYLVYRDKASNSFSFKSLRLDCECIDPCSVVHRFEERQPDNPTTLFTDTKLSISKVPLSTTSNLSSSLSS